MFPFGPNLISAIAAYDKKIREKSVSGDYRILEKDYSFNDDPKAADNLEKKRA